ncbi:MAG: hypothetical protein Q9218_005605, partial [Villophora microphyllina]
TRTRDMAMSKLAKFDQSQLRTGRLSRIELEAQQANPEANIHPCHDDSNRDAISQIVDDEELGMANQTDGFQSRPCGARPVTINLTFTSKSDLLIGLRQQ